MTDVDIDAFAATFIETYNKPESDITGFYSKDLIWFEVPGGRSGGQKEFFDALQAVRGVLTDLQITETVRTFKSGRIGILEDMWTAKVVADGSTMTAIQSWVWEFDDDGLIRRQHDYFMPVGDGPIG